MKELELIFLLLFLLWNLVKEMELWDRERWRGEALRPGGRRGEDTKPYPVKGWSPETRRAKRRRHETVPGSGNEMVKPTEEVKGRSPETRRAKRRRHETVPGSGAGRRMKIALPRVYSPSWFELQSWLSFSFSINSFCKRVKENSCWALLGSPFFLSRFSLIHLSAFPCSRVKWPTK